MSSHHETGPTGLIRRSSRSSAATANFSLEVFDDQVVPSSLGSISPILRAAKEVEAERPRVAYLCKLDLDVMFSSVHSEKEEEEKKTSLLFSVLENPRFWVFFSVF